MKNLTFKAAMLKGSQPTVNRRSTDGQSQRHCKQTPLSKRWKVLMTLVFLFTFSIGNVWGASTTMPTSGSFSNGVTKYELTNSTSVVKNNNKIWWATRGSLSVSSDFGMRPYQHGFVVSVTGPVKLTFNVKSNSTSARTITGQAYVMTDPFFYVWKNTSASSSLETYVRGVNSKAAKDRTEEEAAIAADDKLKTITSSKDANKKMLTCESPEASLATAHRHAISHNCPTTKGATNLFADTLSAAGNYIIYLTSSGGNVGLTSIEVDPLYPVRTTLTNVTKTSGDTLSGVTNYSAVYAASAGYTLPSTISVTIGGTPAVATNDYTWNAATGTLTVPANKITGVITVEISGETMAGYDATYSSSKGSAPAKAEGVSSVTLAEITGVAGWKNTGWTADVATKVGTTDKAAGAHLDNGATVTLLENTTFTAEWAQLYTVTYNKASSEGGNVPTQEALLNGETFDVAGQGTLTAPTTGYIFRGWSDGIAANPYEEGDDYTINGANVNFTAVWEAPVTYTVALDANGGTIASYDGWDKEGNVYSKTVTEGTDVSLLAFTKDDVQLMFFRDGSANEYSGSVTLNSDMNLSAVWGEEKEVELYYWEGKEGGAIERGGTASTKDAGDEVNVNYHHQTYYTMRLNDKTYDTGKRIEIALDQNVKAGDEVAITAYCWSSGNTSSPKMADATDSSKELFKDGESVAEISGGGSPAEKVYTVNSGINSSKVQLTRNISKTNCFVTKIVITGTRLQEVMEPAAVPSISVQPTGAEYAWNATVAALTVTASVTDGGTLSYQWYKAGEPATKVGTNSAFYTPTESGTYYVVVTNSKTGFESKSATSSNAVITIAAQPSYKVAYYDGATKLGEEDVKETESPADYADYQAKALYGISGLYTFNGWYSNSDLADEHKIANVAALAIGEATNIYGKWTKKYAEDVDIAAYAAENVDDDSSNDAEELAAFKTWFTGKGYVHANLNGLDKTTTNNGAYAGIKTKSNAAYYAFNVVANKRVTIKLGYMAGAAEVYINGVKNETQALTGGSTSSGDNYADWYYDVTEESTLQLKIVNGGTCVLKAVTIGEIPAVSDDATLSDLTLKYGEEDAATITGFVSSKYVYNVVMPYGTTKAGLPIVGATATQGAKSLVTINQAKDRDDWKTVIRVQAEDRVDEHDKYYEVRFIVEPKQGVSLIKVTIPNGNGNTQTIDAANITGYIGGTATQKLESGKHKLGSGGHFIGMTLAEGTFQENDIVVVNVETVKADLMRVFKENTASEANVVASSTANMTVGDNYVTLGATTTNSLYLRRGTNEENYQKDWNPFIGSFEVQRYMAPFIESFMIGTVSGTIDEEHKTIAIELPYGTSLSGVAATVEAYANGSATVDAPTELAYNTPLVYTVSSAYTEDVPVAYTVTITEAVAIKEVVISGTLAVLEDETTTLSAVVYDTNDQVASIQDVTWSVKAGDEALASVTSAGVVTGKAVGTAHIIATSEADNTKSAEVAVVVSENLCRTWTNPTATNEERTLGKMKVTPTGITTLQENMVPYQGATACNAWKLDSKNTKYVEINFTDNAQFQSLTLGVSSNGSNKNYKFAVVCSSKAGEHFSDGILSAASYDAVDNDEAEALVDVELATGTKAVRVYREVVVSSTTYGGGSSVFLYYINACKKDFVPVTAVAVADANLAIGKSMTLSATSTPANADIASFTWSIVPPMTATGVSLEGNVLTAAANATEGNVVVKVVAKDVLNNEVEATATISIVNHFDAITPVTETTTWSWETLTVPSGDGPKIATNDTVLANYLSGAEWEQIAGTYNEYVYRSNDNKYYQGTKLNIRTTVPGVLSIKARRADDGDKLYVNGDKVADLTTNMTTYKLAIPAGDVKITGDAKMRVAWMQFQTLDEVTPDYTRPVTIDRMGTVCVDHNVPAGCIIGAEVYKLLYWKYGTSYADCQMVDFEQVDEMEAGNPYLIIPTEETFKLYYGAVVDETPNTVNHFIGTYAAIAQGTEGDAKLMGKYGVVNNQIRLLGAGAYSPANRAYIDLENLQSKEEYEAANTSSPAPKKRISLTRQGTAVTTGLDAISVDSEQPMKVMIDGQLFIIRGEKMFDATGRLVK